MPATNSKDTATTPTHSVILRFSNTLKLFAKNICAMKNATEMFSKGKDFDSALKEAQERGFAEADPTADVDGLDAAAKIATQIALPHRNTGLSQLTAIQSPTVSKRFFLYIR